MLTISIVSRVAKLVIARGMAAELLFGIADNLLRWSVADSFEGRVMAAGMTLVEICRIVARARRPLDRGQATAGVDRHRTKEKIVASREAP